MHMFMLWGLIVAFIALITLVVRMVYNNFKEEQKFHEERMAMLQEGLDIQRRALAALKKPAAAAAGGATTMFLLNQLTSDNNIGQEAIGQMQDMDLQQMQEFAMENNFIDQEEMNNLLNEFDHFDPYTNPGVDLVVDEHYHGIDHGLDNDHFHDDFANDFHDDFDYGFDNDFGNDFGHNDFDNNSFGGGCDHHF